MYYDNLNLNELQFTRLIPPYYGQYSLNPAVTAPLQVDTLFPDLNNIPQFPAPFSMDPSNRSAYTHAVERELPAEPWAATTWSRSPTPAADSQNLHKRYNINQADFGTTPINSRLPFPAVPAGDALLVGHRLGELQGAVAAAREALLRRAVLPRQLPVVGEPGQRFRRGRGERHRVQDRISTPTRACHAITSAIAAPSASATSCRLAKAAAF